MKPKCGLGVNDGKTGFPYAVANGPNNGPGRTGINGT